MIVIRQLRIVVDIDPALAVGMSPALVQRLARGVVAVSCDRGVKIVGLPGVPRDAALVLPSMSIAVAYLHGMAEGQHALAELSGGAGTATGRWLLDRAAFLRLVAQELVQRRAWLWPESVPVAA